MTLALVGKAALRILGFTIPVPVTLILAALAWVQFDKSSAIRSAVNERVKEMVAGAEIEALEAQIAAQRQIAARSAEAAREAQRRLTVEATARTNLSMRLMAIQTENEILNDDLADLLSRPVDRDCAVDADVLGRLQSR
ncbi:hypothetical protein HPDFL43_05920 [Hoeflea phototrophica DFL-43]|jgi:hypothetical protein|uniref:Uncharacterized protein n=1 Tax=Hoeflea phototrophica (strain DSM 17068 / NCIMB 14078 / DFL-43) TaxID=411684 RepID=A9D4V1_HOEPD|nr:hypothetical protein [Hoeflea phototrophica]EDQ33967.1 hypothetical protein HPDFL43_05920 [Hoeflea phototrophica DFL-43]